MVHYLCPLPCFSSREEAKATLIKGARLISTVYLFITCSYFLLLLLLADTTANMTISFLCFLRISSKLIHKVFEEFNNNFRVASKTSNPDKESAQQNRSQSSSDSTDRGARSGTQLVPTLVANLIISDGNSSCKLDLATIRSALALPNHYTLFF